ncbi:glycosyl hydrolase [Cohnella nanjingensis]|uniref:Glycoside hydrolase n=1 Tax=Cohnella nanjingensis TaxID=1387779 RepID=A0A7X0VGG7_9BACL|nr:glycosyl hydrolase [Cohnella nanjingensis]MBB6673105.1 hypothetical protein [Cohnella nanjingensis]
MTHLLDPFRAPPPAYRTAPLWVWNDEMSESVIDFQLRELKNHGFGGAFVHPRPGLVTEYLSEDWFDKWAYALDAAKRLDLKLYIYDENSYPSGFAGGHVPAELPDCLATSVTYRIESIARFRDGQGSAPKWVVNSNFLRAYAVSVAENGRELSAIRRDLTDVPQEEWHLHGEWILSLEIVPPQTMSWLGGFAYVDMMRPEVTQAFLKSTYEAYYARFGADFGSRIPAIFTDEPAVTGSGIYNVKKTELPFSYWFAAEFEKRRGYHLLDHLPALFKNVPYDGYVKDPVKVRYDYYCTVRELWVENSIQPIARWCEEHGVAWTGHFLENFWPLAGGMMVSPSIMSAYEYFQWPAIDLLLGSPLRDKPTDDLLVTLLEAKSVANQFGKTRVLCEAYGAGGWDSALEDYKRMGDWLFVHGINFLNPHYTLTTTAGARKRDHPQSFDWREPWWEDYTGMNDYNGRVSYLLSQGATKQRILVLHPTTTGYLVPKEEEDSDIMWNKPPLNPDMRSYLAMLQALTAGQWDFDLGDEFIMQRHGRVRRDRLAVGKQEYGIVVVSGDTRNLNASTMDLLQAFLGAGGIVLAAGEPGPYIEGERKPEAYRALAALPGYRSVDGWPGLERELARTLPKRIKSASPWPLGMAHMRRELDDGLTVYFFVNHSMGAYESFVELEGGRLEKWNPWNGETESVAYARTAFGVGLPMRLNRNESLLLVVGRVPEADAPADENATSMSGTTAAGYAKFANGTKAGGDAQPFSETRPLSAPLLAVEPEEPNVLVIDYCDLSVDGKTYKDMNTIEAGHALFRHRGFNQNPWDNSVQFKRRILDRNAFGEGSGFSATYRFDAGAGLPDEPLYLVAERTACYALEVNGRPAAWLPGEAWLDHHHGAADIRPFLREGANTLTLTAARFDVRLEVEPVYLRGAFAVGSADGAWRLEAPKPVALGAWTGQGYPFYPGAFRYRYALEVPRDAASVLAVLPEDLEATACSLFVDGIRVGLIGIDDGGRADLAPYLAAGTHEVTLRVCGGLKNLFGPHHDPDRSRRTAWPNMWRKAPKYGRPAAELYDLVGYGAGEPLRFEAALRQ